ncbi:hypothetical protein CCZ01_04190 [Helicobacter monodelphidis]|uniref:type II secretion system GspH family protein n=1 Tax=Helicobacter sp. 15-1451 TaxID=2004995 RepID=UPI000DCC129F|nr:type II secretion system GspH family protein [Helicobacter sp. 15-1451]RAX58017.1 hypothetical protein CCZ01_04190 [Helicobacter sp. 15-1451]
MLENLVWIAIIGIVCALFCILVYIYIKDLETMKLLKQQEKIIDELLRQIHKVDKKQKEDKQDNDYSIAFNTLSRNLKEELQDSVSKISSQIYAEVEMLKEEFQEYKEQLDDRLGNLEEKIKEVSYFPTSANGVDGEKIISMFKDGWSVDSIAKELRVSKGEVEFTLKLANI